MLHSFICILDFNISNLMQPLISRRREMHAQYKMFPSKSQFLLMQRGPTGHSVARANILFSKHLLKLGMRDHLVFQTTALSYHVLRSA